MNRQEQDTILESLYTTLAPLEIDKLLRLFDYEGPVVGREEDNYKYSDDLSHSEDFIRRLLNSKRLVEFKKDIVKAELEGGL